MALNSDGVICWLYTYKNVMIDGIYIIQKQDDGNIYIIEHDIVDKSNDDDNFDIDVKNINAIKQIIESKETKIHNYSQEKKKLKDLIQAKLNKISG